MLLFRVTIFIMLAANTWALSFTYSTIDDPNGTYTTAYGINNSGQIVGAYLNGSVYNGFLYSGGSFVATLMAPSETQVNTDAFGINDSGDIVGYYQGNNGLHGFLATPGATSATPEPGTGSVVALTLLLGIAARCRGLAALAKKQAQ